MSSTVTTAQAKKVLAAVQRVYHVYLDGLDPDSSSHPKLVMDREWIYGDMTDAPVIIWEEGPYEWAYKIASTVSDPTIFVEPYNSWALCIYREDAPSEAVPA